MQQWFKHNKTKVALLLDDDAYTYDQLNQSVFQFASGLLAGKQDLAEERVAFLLPASLDYVTVLLGVWCTGGIAVPLNIGSSHEELKHALSCAQVTRLITKDTEDSQMSELCASLGIEMLPFAQLISDQKVDLPEISSDRRAMILFTSGTTNKPKGVVSTHKNISAQIKTLIKAWAWHEDDSIPLFLPLHHIHGIINILCCALWSGATVRLFTKFDIEAILQHVKENNFNVFMAVPTIYIKLISHIKNLSKDEKSSVCAGFSGMRLNVSGSSACPVKVYNQWLELTGKILLERYGMTEIGMALANPYDGERRAGAVGLPLPGVEVKIFDEENNIIEEGNIPGEIRIKGENVFLEYWNNSTATKESFQNDWFCTGDIAVIESYYYRIMGRASIDIIKSGGYKLSALEIEGVLLNHDKISECAVIGLEDDIWGEAVTACLVLHGDTELSLKELKSWCKDKMSAYKVPRNFKVLPELPKNAMGKVTKSTLKLICVDARN